MQAGAGGGEGGRGKGRNLRRGMEKGIDIERGTGIVHLPPCDVRRV